MPQYTVLSDALRHDDVLQLVLNELYKHMSEFLAVGSIYFGPCVVCRAVFVDFRDVVTGR